jgi:hypothetical protein
MNWIDDQTLYNSEKSLKNEIRIFGIISIILLIMSIVLFIGLLFIEEIKNGSSIYEVSWALFLGMATVFAGSCINSFQYLKLCKLLIQGNILYRDCLMNGNTEEEALDASMVWIYKQKARKSHKQTVAANLHALKDYRMESKIKETRN